MSNQPNFQEMLAQAVSEPGKISKAYSTFHNYSMSNAWLALWECAMRGIEPGPINTYNGWFRLGRQVTKGQKAISLIMPVTQKFVRESRKDDGSTESKESSFTRFILRPNWFVLSQTDGQVYTAPKIESWSDSLALSTLEITREPFADLDGNTQGYAKPGRVLAISPIAALPHKTLFHEMAHILLGHLEQSTMADGDRTPKSLKEVEAESVAYICCAALELDGLEYSRGYIQHWLHGQEIPEKSAQKIFAVANSILKAGKPAQNNA
jgi:antirestriction protein ArdC